MSEYTNNINMALSNNYIVSMGNDKKELDFYVVDVSLPDVNIVVSEVEHYGGRAGKNIGTKFVYDNKVTYGNVTIQFLLDEELYVYRHFMGLVKEIITENGNNNLSMVDNITAILTTNKKNPILKMRFGNCKFSSISIGSYNNANGDSYKTLDVTFSIETFDIDDM